MRITSSRQAQSLSKGTTLLDPSNGYMQLTSDYNGRYFDVVYFDIEEDGNEVEGETGRLTAVDLIGCELA